MSNSGSGHRAYTDKDSIDGGQQWKSIRGYGKALFISTGRHPVYGVHVALLVGLPENIAHIAGAHSMEGENLERSLVAQIVFTMPITLSWRCWPKRGLSTNYRLLCCFHRGGGVILRPQVA